MTFEKLSYVEQRLRSSIEKVRQQGVKLRRGWFWRDADDKPLPRRWRMSEGTPSEVCFCCVLGAEALVYLSESLSVGAFPTAHVSNSVFITIGDNFGITAAEVSRISAGFEGRENYDVRDEFYNLGVRLHKEFAEP
jgi:hypothetical protein